MDKIIYMDNAATTRLKPEVFAAMEPYLKEQFYNASSAYSPAGLCAGDVTKARESIAELINANANEIFFTGGGSESDNWALKGIAFANRYKGNHIITSKIEHHAILHTCEYLERQGFSVTYLDVDENGLVNPDDVEKSIKPETILISIMFANNEIGTIEPVKEIGEIAKKHNIYFHTDAVQAFGHVCIDVNEMNIDMLSASAHKLNGPKGTGLLYIRKGTRIDNLIHGGAQENGMRAGTTNTAGIIGFAKACEIAKASMKKVNDYETELRDYMIEKISSEIPYSLLNGHRTERLSNNVNFCFRFIEGESLLLMLDNKGICASSGSACTSGSLDPSHVLLAIGRPHEIAHGSLRLTISDETTKDEADFVIDAIKTTVERLRSMSPLYEDFIKNNK